eukprot:357921-Chlamydomonas_euryale.AAC.2
MRRKLLPEIACCKSACQITHAARALLARTDAGAKRDRFHAGAKHDRFHAGAKRDRLHAGAKRDRLYARVLQNKPHHLPQRPRHVSQPTPAPRHHRATPAALHTMPTPCPHQAHRKHLQLLLARVNLREIGAHALAFIPSEFMNALRSKCGGTRVGGCELGGSPISGRPQVHRRDGVGVDGVD